MNFCLKNEPKRVWAQTSTGLVDLGKQQDKWCGQDIRFQIDSNFKLLVEA